MLYNARGNLNVVTSDSSAKGAYSASGKLRVTVVNGSSLTGLYALDGSINVVIVTATATFAGLYHPCGALRVSEATSEKGLFAPTGSYYVEGSGGGSPPGGPEADFSEETNSMYIFLLEEF